MKHRGFTLVEVAVALLLLAFAASAVIAALSAVQRSAQEARRLGAELAALANAAEYVLAAPSVPVGVSDCPGVRPADYRELGGFRCRVRRAAGSRSVEVVLEDGRGRVFAATVGALR